MSLEKININEHDKPKYYLSILSTFQTNRGCFVVGSENGQIISLGYIKDAAKDRGAARLEFFVVVENYRGKKVGTYLMTHICNKFNESSGITLSCEKSLISFYKKCGFVKPIKSSENNDYYTMHSKRSARNTLYESAEVNDVIGAARQYLDARQYFGLN
ncbi:GNAT family N-acetyltransferase [Photobacterium chitinilyticum]|nr:GNAT family N-acetyltransferase [Photobacterium chitinilyticum]